MQQTLRHLEEASNHPTRYGGSVLASGLDACQVSGHATAAPLLATDRERW